MQYVQNIILFTEGGIFINSVIRVMDKISSEINRIISFIAIILALVIITVNVVQIIGRYIFFYSIPWAVEASTYIFIWLILLGGSYSVREDSELKIELLRFKNPVISKTIKLIQDILSLITISVYFASSLVFFSNSLKFKQTSSSLGISLSFIFVALPIGFLLIAIEKVIIITKRLIDKGNSEAGMSADNKQ